MSDHKKPMSQELRQALIDHHLATDTPSQLADSFRHGWHAAQAQQGWQPIESAPRDTALLLWLGAHYELGHFNTALNEWVCGWDHRKLKEPTHWMPLPAAPK